MPIKWGKISVGLALSAVAALSGCGSAPPSVTATPVSVPVVTTTPNTATESVTFIEAIDPDLQQIAVELGKMRAHGEASKTTNVDQVPALFRPLIDVLNRASQRFSYLSCPPSMQSDFATFRTGLTEETALIQGLSDALSLNYTLANPPNLDALNKAAKEDFYAGVENLYRPSGIPPPFHATTS